MNGLHILQNPNGTWSFVGRVPLALGYETDATGELRRELFDAARHSGPEIAQRIARRKGATFKTRVWRTRSGAYDAAVAAGCHSLLLASGEETPTRADVIAEGEADSLG